MKPKEALKTVWRSILAQHEAKLAFYRRNKTLVESKKWDYLFRVSHLAGVKLVFFDSEKELLYLEKDGITVVTKDDYGIFVEILVDNVYMFPPQLTGKFSVFDVGMNRGFATLFFANNPDCTKVFGFELDKNIYARALQNFALNPAISTKITPFNFGLWNENEQIDVFKSEIDAETSIVSCVEQSKHLKTKSQEKKIKNIIQADVKKSSEVFAPMLNQMPADEKKILKIDIEGAEYAVFEDLYNNGLLQKFDVIMGEAHNGLAGLEKYLGDFVCVNKNCLSDLLITFCYINKRLVQ